jgi:hypothetical protein
MLNRIYKFLTILNVKNILIGIREVLLSLSFLAVLMLCFSYIDKDEKKNHCEQQLELVKQGAKQGVHEFLNEFGLEYRKKAK